MPRTHLPSPTPLPPSPLLSIVIPVFNECETIGTLLERVRSAPTPGWRCEVIVVDDGSTDGTTSVLRAWLAAVEPKQETGTEPEARPAVPPGPNPASTPQTVFKLVEMPHNQGKGAALRKGFALCEGAVVLIQDADLEYDPGDYPALLAPFGSPSNTVAALDSGAASLSGTGYPDNAINLARVVYGSRILHPENRRHSALRFYLGGRLVTLITNLLFGSRLSDEPTGYKLFRRDVLQAIPLECQGFEFCPEVTAKLLRLGVPIREVPIRYSPRKPEDGKKIGWTDGVEALWTLWRWRWKSF